jgi:dihydrofolate reductase
MVDMVWIAGGRQIYTDALNLLLPEILILFHF